MPEIGCMHGWGQVLGEEHLFEDGVFWHEVAPEGGELGHVAANGTA